MDEKPRTLFQFRLTDILWAVVAVALIAGWLGDRRRLAQENASLLDKNVVLRQANSDLDKRAKFEAWLREIYPYIEQRSMPHAW
jgi:hypothetical protein